MRQWMARPAIQNLAAFIIISVAGLISFSNIWESPFAYDDKGSIVENSAIHIERLDFKSLKKAALTGSSSSRPLVGLTFALNYYWGKSDVWGYHLFNLLVHLGSGFFVFLLSRMIFERVSRPWKGSSTPDRHVIFSMAMLSALIFLVHPVQTQSVTYIAQRYTSMSGMFYLASVYFYLRARFASGRMALAGFIMLCICCGFSAFLCKQNAASLPLAILLAEYILVDQTWQAWRKKLWWIMLGILVFLAFVLLVTGKYSGPADLGKLLEDISELSRETTSVSRWQYLCTQFRVILVYMRLLVFPAGQNLDWAYPFQTRFFSGYTPAAFLALLGVFLFALRNMKKLPIVSMGILWFFVTLSVESSIIPISDALYEHRLYLPLFGFALIASYLVFFTGSRKLRWALAASALIVIILGTATFHRNKVWYSEFALWSDSVDKNPMNPRAQNNLGKALAEKGQLIEAKELFISAIKMHGKGGGYYGDILNNLGSVYAIEGDLSGAKRCFLKAISINKRYAKAYLNLGGVLARQGKINEAEGYFKKAVSLKEGYSEAYYNLGLSQMRQEKYEEALENLRKAQEAKGCYAEAHSNIGQILFRKGRIEEARNNLEAALKLNPNLAAAHHILGLILAGSGHFKDAEIHFLEALRINPKSKETRRCIDVLRQKGKPE